MSEAKPILLIAAMALSLTACATRPASRDAIAHVNPASLAAAPAEWDGREVEVVGLLVWEYENLGLYQGYGAYCRAESAPRSTSIGALGTGSPGVTIAGRLSFAASSATRSG